MPKMSAVSRNDTLDITGKVGVEPESWKHAVWILAPGCRGRGVRKTCPLV